MGAIEALIAGYATTELGKHDAECIAAARAELAEIVGERDVARVSCMELRDELAEKDAWIDKLNRALVSLTPLGSEFHMNPERCVQFVRDMREGEHRALVDAVKARRAAEAQIERLTAALQSIVDDLELRMGAGTICLATPTQIAKDALSGTPANAVEEKSALIASDEAVAKAREALEKVELLLNVMDEGRQPGSNHRAVISALAALKEVEE
jgi:hypothetical protein